MPSHTPGERRRRTARNSPKRQRSAQFGGKKAAPFDGRKGARKKKR